MEKQHYKDKNRMPRFSQIVEHLKGLISQGKLAEHAPLPSERIISEQFEVSRMTARKALLAMEAEGLAYSSGRRGRFVSPKRVVYDVCKMISFSASALSEDVDLTIKLLSAETVNACPSVANTLRISPGDLVHKYTRLFLVKGHPTFLETEIMTAALFPDLLNQNLEQSTSLLVEHKYKIRPHTGNVVMRMRPVRDDEARLLGLSRYQPGIELEQTSFAQDGRPYCYDLQIWRGELAEFAAETVVQGTSKNEDT